MYHNLTDGESVHLEMLPELDESLIDEKLEEKMDLVRKIVTLGRSSREDAGIKVRQPLSEILLDKSHETLLQDVLSLIKDELNVKEVVFSDDLSKYMNFELKPNFKVAGSILGKNVGALAKELKSLDSKDLLDRLEESLVVMKLNGEDVEIKKEYIEVRISSKEGFDITMDKNIFVILDTELTPELRDEGYMRELVSKVQQQRKQNGYEVTDEIEISVDTDDETFKSFENFKDEIMEETLATKLIREKLDVDEQELNDRKVKFVLKRV